jgi:hypothetical protein
MYHARPPRANEKAAPLPPRLPAGPEAERGAAGGQNIYWSWAPPSGILGA